MWKNMRLRLWTIGRFCVTSRVRNTRYIVLVLSHGICGANHGVGWQEFMVRVKSELDGPETMLFRVNIDGHSLAGQVCNSGVEKYVDGVSVSNTLLRPFKFASWSTGAPYLPASPLIRTPIRNFTQRTRNPKQDVAHGTTSGSLKSERTGSE